MNLYNPYFSHIYIEKNAYDYPLTKLILSKLQANHSTLVEIDHYKDIFNRRNQNFHEQKKAPSLILAVKTGQKVYQGAPVCQNFGQEHFYYTSCMMNCIYDCEYCYLQGMYPSGHIVVFVNLSDIFMEVEKLLQQHPVYLCISYDTDLLAAESLFGFVHEWMQFVNEQPNLTVELRTKSANLSSIKELTANDRFILAWTISPDVIAKQFECHTPSLSMRIKQVQEAIDLCYPVRLCFDPMIYVKNWREEYQNLIKELTNAIDFTKLRDISIGVFRISADYMTTMRKQRPNSIIVNFPYENDHGVFHLNLAKSKEMIQFMVHELEPYIAKEKLFLWEEN